MKSRSSSPIPPPALVRSVDVIVVVRDPDPYTKTHFVEVKFGNGGWAQNHYTFLLCGELLSTPHIVEESYGESRFVFPFTYRRPGTYTVEATARTHQNVCVVPLEPEQEGKASAQLTVAE